MTPDMRSRVKADWIVRSGQGWKLLVFIGPALLAIYFLVTPLFQALKAFEFLSRVSFGFLLGGASVVWLLLSIRCRWCNRKPMPRLFRHAPSDKLLEQVFAAERCPYCNNHLRGRPEIVRRSRS